MPPRRRFFNLGGSMVLTDKGRTGQLEDIIMISSRDPRLQEAVRIERPALIRSLARTGLGIDPEMDIAEITDGPDGQRIANELFFVMAGIRDSMVGRDEIVQHVKT